MHVESTSQEGNAADDPDSLLREEEAAAFLNCTPRALQAWRKRGDGPPYIRLGSRSIRYRRRDLLTWSAIRRHVPSTRERA